MTSTSTDTSPEVAIPQGETARDRALPADRTMARDDDNPPREEDRSERALRVSQLDADEMDAGLIHMLNAKISRALSVFGVSAACGMRSL